MHTLIYFVTEIKGIVVISDSITIGQIFLRLFKFEVEMLFKTDTTCISVVAFIFKCTLGKTVSRCRYSPPSIPFFWWISKGFLVGTVCKQCLIYIQISFRGRDMPGDEPLHI